MAKMPLAPSFEYEIRPELIASGFHIRLRHSETLAEKNFYLAGAKDTATIANHMESLTEDQCEQFVAVKVAKKKEKKT